MTSKWRKKKREREGATGVHKRGFRCDTFDDDDLALLERQPATLDDTTTVDEASVAPRSEDDAGVWHQEAREVTESEVAVSPMVVDDSDW